jgi:hypothetical protein
MFEQVALDKEDVLIFIFFPLLKNIKFKLFLIEIIFI